MFISRGEPRLELGVHVFGIILVFKVLEFFWKYLEMKVEVIILFSFIFLFI